MPNHLSGETSPYLLQHADNPVDWHPWNDGALKLARDQDRPILLSIGYSACHWCHVMAHESFEDDATAALMNRLYVNIKVDREERPDLDKIYQLAHQLMAQRGGGWPLTVVLDPKTHAPFFAGTYFPLEPRHGLPGFKDLLVQVAEWYGHNKDQLQEQHTRLQAVFRQVEAGAPTQDSLTLKPVAEAFEQLRQQFDPDHGGFGDAPKFPHPSNLEFLIRRSGHASTAETHADISMALFSLQRMALGGIYDQLGGGFCRYSVDPFWMIPHFEKMLYDNGPLLALCSAANRVDSKPVYAHAAHGIADWVMREMQSPQGGYYSSIDADSEGHEGKFYAWTLEEIQSVVGEKDFPLFSRCYGLDRHPNFEGQWHLHTFIETPALAKEFALDEAEIDSRLVAARQKLFMIREKRIHPGRDDKVLTSWNALMIHGMAIAARNLGRADCYASARRALDFIREKLWVNGRLLATCKDGRAHLPAYLDDHAFLLGAIMEMLQVEWHNEDLQFARVLADALLENFEDPKDGGFYFTAHDHEPLLHRPRPLMDESVPPGNAVAVRALLQLGHLLGETRYLESAECCLRFAWQPMQKHPIAHTTMLMALEEYLEPSEVIVLRGKPEAVHEWREHLGRQYQPQRMVFAIDAGLSGLPDALAAKEPRGDAVAYVCRGPQCSPPLYTLAELENHVTANA